MLSGPERAKITGAATDAAVTTAQQEIARDRFRDVMSGPAAPPRNRVLDTAVATDVTIMDD